MRTRPTANDAREEPQQGTAMNRGRKMLLALAGLILALLLSLPLVQRLSIDLMELQYRERILADTETLGGVAESFEIAIDDFARPLGATHIDSDQLAAMTLVDVATATRRSVQDVKRTIAEVAIGDQVGDAYGWTFWIGSRDATPDHAR